jgi:hypothetical protein
MSSSNCPSTNPQAREYQLTITKKLENGTSVTSTYSVPEEDLLDMVIAECTDAVSKGTERPHFSIHGGELSLDSDHDLALPFKIAILLSLLYGDVEEDKGADKDLDKEADEDTESAIHCVHLD